MITTINADNKAAYLKYFQEITQLLSTHDASGASCTQFSTTAVLQPKYVGKIDEDSFEQEYYVVGTKQENDTYIYDSKYATVWNADAEYGTIGVDSLVEVYDLLRYLGDVSSWKRYTRLPLDEPCFYIDADTRTIEVPPEFKNGVAVKGDESSEIIYFKVNRFVDTADLADEKMQIYIQWESAAKDEKGNKITGNTIPYIIDVESEPGYMIFGWPLTQEITQEAGTVTFAVRVFLYDGINPITYSWATQNQTVKILSSLDFTITAQTDAEAIDKNTDIRDRLITSSIRQSGTNIVEATAPIFFDDLKLEAYRDSTLNAYIMKKDIDKLKVEAYSTDAGRINYIWTKYDIINNNSAVGESKQITSEVVMSPIDKDSENEAVDNKVYYINSGTSTAPIYTIITGDTLTADLKKDSDVTVYEHCSIGTIDGPGCYAVKAVNRVNLSSDYALSPEFDATAEDFTELDKFLIVPRPSVGSAISDVVAPTIQLADSAITLTAGDRTWDGPYVGAETYQWQYSPDGEESTYEDVAAGDKLSINDAGNELSIIGSFEIKGVERTTLVSVGDDEEFNLDEESNLQDSYWYYDSVLDTVLTQSTDTEKKSGRHYLKEVSTEDTYDYKKPVVPDGESTAVNDGYYRVKAINSLNTDTSETPYSNSIRISYPIVRPKCTISINDIDILEDGKQCKPGTTLKATASLPDDVVISEPEKITYTYQWYKYSATPTALEKFNGTLPACVARWMAAHEVFEPDEDTQLENPNVDTSEYTVPEQNVSGYIYCVATAEYYGTTYSSVSTPFVSIAEESY